MSDRESRTSISLVRCAEPLTPAATPEHDDESNWALCDAYRALRSQIERYARGEILGQSMLLAGHRGSGKTTLVHLAVQQVRWLAEDSVRPSTMTVAMEGDWDPFSKSKLAGFSFVDGLRTSPLHIVLQSLARPRELTLIGLKPLLADDELLLTEQGEANGYIVFRAAPKKAQARERLADIDGTLTSTAPKVGLGVTIAVNWQGECTAEIRIPQTLFAARVQPFKVSGDLDLRVRRPFAAIPFLVPLHGPDLFLVKGKLPDDDGRSLAEQAMSQIRRAVHRALAEEIGKRFCKYANASENRDMAEAATQLRIELDQTPPLSLLRMYWDKAGLLESGLLGGFRRAAGRIMRSQENGLQSQGFREILALYTAVEAVREPDKHDREDGLKPPAKPVRSEHGHIAGFEDNLKSPDRLQEAVRLAAPVLSLLAGAFAAHAVIEVLGPITAFVIAVITVLMSYSFLLRTIPGRPDATLTGDPSVGSQDLLLPLLVERALDAGFAPIFVVDELDKIQGDLDEKLGALMKRLKYFVTDRAFFCFVADRSYYEQFQNEIRHRAYPIQDTYYADRLLIYHSHTELHEYLKKLLKIPGGEPGGGLLIEMLRYVILLQSYAHVGALTRALKQNSESERIRLSEESHKLWTVAGYRLAIVMQVAIECVVEDPIVASRLQQEPHFTQWLHDALYYFPREWREDVRSVRYTRGNANLQTSARPISSILERRLVMDSNAERRGELASLDERDKDFLYDQMEQLAKYLAYPKQLAFKVMTDGTRRWPPSILLLVLQAMPLVTEETRENARHYSWVFDQYGREIQRETPLVPGCKEWLEAVALDDSPSIFAAASRLWNDLKDLVANGIKVSDGMEGIFKALQHSPGAADKTHCDVLKEKVADEYHWQSQTQFKDLVDDIEKAIPVALRRLAAECLIQSQWRPIFWLLAVASQKRRSDPSVAISVGGLFDEQQLSGKTPADWAIDEIVKAGGKNDGETATNRELFANRFTGKALAFLGNGLTSS